MFTDVILKKYLASLKDKMKNEGTAAYLLALNEAGETEIYSISDKEPQEPIIIGQCTVINTEDLNKLKSELNKLKYNL